jgi:Ca2+/H+ antiporter, TMEM165/GDT1 family
MPVAMLPGFVRDCTGTRAGAAGILAATDGGINGLFQGPERESRPGASLEALLVSTGIVALAEMGDKTQLLALVLAARYRGRHGAVILGILVATLANHALAAGIGAWLTGVVGAEAMRWIVGVSFLAMAAWILVPDKPGEDAGGAERFGAFGTTLVAFFLVEMGDKTQVATVALAARYAAIVAVVAGTTLGMMIANVPAVWVGERLLRRVPVRAVHAVAAALFVALGVLALFGMRG